MQLHWLGRRNYLPLFVTQMLDAGNAGLVWSLLIWSLADHGDGGQSYTIWLAISTLVFTLAPWLLAVPNGRQTTHDNKPVQLKRLKLANILVLILGAAALPWANPPLLWLTLLGLSLHMGLIRPVKNAYLAPIPGPHQSARGQALLIASTYLSFSTGLAGAAALIHSGHTPSAGLIFLPLALLGYGASHCLPDTAAFTATQPCYQPDNNQSGTTWPPGQSQGPGLTQARWGQAWFKSLGLLQILLAPGLASQWLQGGFNSGLVLLILPALGVAAGAWLGAGLSRGGIEIGLIPMGALGMALCGLLTWALASTWLVQITLVLLGMAAGLYTLPLHALVAKRLPTAPRYRHQATGPIPDALLATTACLAILLLIWLGLSAASLFLLISLLNLAVFIYSFACLPQYLARFVVWGLTHSLYRVRHDNLQAIPAQGPAVLVCNHVSFMDPALILGAVKRPVRFVMAHTIFYNPLFNGIFRLVGAIPIAPRREDEAIYHRAFESIEHYLAQGEIVCIFPEGGITRDGHIQTFKSGVEKIIQRTPVPVVPLAIQGMWGSYFSRHPDKGFGRRLWSRVRLVAGAPMTADKVSRHELQRQVTWLRGQWP